MRVFLISNMYPSPESPYFGIFVKNFEEALKEKGVVFTRRSLITGRSKSPKGKLLDYVRFFVHTWRSLLRGDYDLIYVHYAAHSTWPLVPLLPFIRKPIVVNAHGGDLTPVSSRLGALRRALTGAVLAKSAAIVVPSHYFSNIAQERYGVPPAKICISPSGGVDARIFRPDGKPFAERGVDLLFVSRMDAKKGWDTFIEAVSLLKQRLNGKLPRILMIGSGREDDHKQALIRQLGLEKDITPGTGVPQSELAAIFNNAKAMVFPTRLTESLGLVGIEAMACGTPVIGSAIGGLTDFIRDGVNGFMFPPGDAAALAEKMFTFLQLPETEKVRMSEEAIRTAGLYERESVNEQLFERLKEIIHQKG